MDLEGMEISDAHTYSQTSREPASRSETVAVEDMSVSCISLLRGNLLMPMASWV